MFKQLGNLASLMQQAQSMSANMKLAQERLASRRCTGKSPDGQVELDLNGQYQVLGCRIDPVLLNASDAAAVESRVAAAVGDALEQVKLAHAEEVQQATGGLNLPGLSDMLSNLGAGK